MGRFDLKLVLRSPFRLQHLPIWMIAASFGPYVLMGIGVRTEHILIYGLIPLALIVFPLRSWSVVRCKPVFRVWTALIFITIWTLAVTFLGGKDHAALSKVAAHLENYVQPIAIIIIFGSFVRPEGLEEARSLLRGACKCLIAFLIANSVIAVMSIFMDTQIFTHYFVGMPGDTGETVSALAATMGRFSGIFNQPIESGLTYSLGILAWSYLSQLRDHDEIRDWFILFGLFVGGVLSVSKVFIIGGTILFCIYHCSHIDWRRIFNWRLAFIGLVLIACGVFVASTWSGFKMLVLLFSGPNKQTDFLTLYTAYRFGGSGSTVAPLFSQVKNISPLCGLGFAAFTTFDNGYAEFFVQGGLVGLGVYLFILTTIGWSALCHYYIIGEGRLLFYISLLLIGAGLGGPVLTINHFSTIVWVFVLLIFIVFHNYEKRNDVQGTDLVPAPVDAYDI